MKRAIKILDSTPIILKGRGFDEWAQSYANDQWQGIKLHAEYDVGAGSMTRAVTSHANFNDCSMGQKWPIDSNTIYIFDRGYVDFNWWWSIHKKSAFFVTRFRKNTSIIIENNKDHLTDVILADETFKFKNKNPRGKKKNLYSESLRRIHVFREGKPPLILVTNLHDVAAESIARLYKDRWAIELFFKWIKQNLKIKKFLGKSETAVKTQLATALIAYVLIQLYKVFTNDSRNLYLILSWIKCNQNIKFKNKKKPPSLKEPSFYRHTVRRGY
jgi:IS4 transposase